jgi:putative ABC transport system permease protein
MNGASSRAVIRIARRNIARSRWRSLLVIVLVALPVAAMVGATTILQAVTPTAAQRVTSQMGAADLLVLPTQPGATIDALQVLLPSSSRVEPFTIADGRLILGGTGASVTLRSMDLDGLARGMITLTDGRAPRDPGEVAVTPAVARLAGVGLGGSINLQGLGSPTVVGLVEDRFDLKARVVLRDVSAAVAAAAQGQATLLVGLPSGMDPSSVDRLTGATTSKGPLFLLTTRGQATDTDATPSAGIIVLGGLALLEAALVASAAFAVGIRRRQRELGLLAAAGAEPRHLAGTVLAEGLLLGGSGAVIGTLVGLAGAVAASPWLDQLTDRRNPAVVIAPGLILVAGGFGLMATLVAALVPAWTAAHVPVLAALSGRRPAQAPARRTLRLGLVLIGLAIAMTATGATLRLHDTDGSSYTLSIVLLFAGAIVGTLGFGACSPWLLERLEPPAARLPLTSRIALRDTARARSRNGPIVTALLASFAATVAIAALIASLDASAAAQWQPWLQPDQILIRGDGVASAGPEAAHQLDAVAAGPILGAGTADRLVWIGPAADADVNDGLGNVTVGDAELLKALGAEEATLDLADGAVVLLSRQPSLITHVTIHVIDAQGVTAATLDAPARVVVTGTLYGDLPGAVISAQTAARVGLAVGTSDRFLIRLDHPVSDADLARAAATAAAYPGTTADVSRLVLPNEDFRVAVLIASLLFALAVTGIAVALGETEARPEQRTLLALGADPEVRRRIAAARAAVISLLAGALAVPAGLLPVWGLLASRGSPLVVPLPEITAALVVLPLLAVAATFVVTRPIPAWSAFRGAGS